MRVLVVDPQRTERETTLRLISSETHDVRQANDAASALVLMEGTEFDVVLVESTMAGVTGNELIKRIRARESCTHVYVIASAARTVPGDVKTAFQAGAD